MKLATFFITQRTAQPGPSATNSTAALTPRQPSCITVHYWWDRCFYDACLAMDCSSKCQNFSHLNSALQWLAPKVSLYITCMLRVSIMLSDRYDSCRSQFKRNMYLNKGWDAKGSRLIMHSQSVYVSWGLWNGLRNKLNESKMVCTLKRPTNSDNWHSLIQYSLSDSAWRG